MKITTDRKRLSDALATVARVADPKSLMPILACVRIRATADAGVTLEATDLTVSVSITLEAGVQAPGACVANVRELASLVKAHVGETIALSLEGDVLRVGTSRMGGMLKSEDFPKLPAAADVEAFPIVSATAFAAQLATVLPAVSLDETRHHLNGVLFEMDSAANLLRMVSTDGHRLTKADETAVYSHRTAVKAIVPRKGASLLQRAAAKSSAFRLGAADGLVVAHTDNATYSVKAIDATFPPYDQVIPKDEDRRTLRGNRAALLDALKRACAVIKNVEDVRDSIALGMNLGTLRIAAHAKDDTPAFVADVDVAYDATAFAIGVNPVYLVDALEALDSGESVTLSFGTGEQAALDPIVVVGEDAAALVVVMPVRGEYREAGVIPNASAAAPAAPAADKTRVSRSRKPAPAAKPAPAPVATPPAAPAEAPEPPLPPLQPEATTVAPSAAQLVAEASATALMMANAEVATGIVEAFMVYALRASANAARACYRCHKVKAFAYVLDNQLCCRDCREAHRQDYYASRGQEARPRNRRRHEAPAVQTVPALHIRAEHVTVEPAPIGNA